MKKLFVFFFHSTVIKSIFEHIKPHTYLIKSVNQIITLVNDV